MNTKVALVIIGVLVIIGGIFLITHETAAPSTMDQDKKMSADQSDQGKMTGDQQKEQDQSNQSQTTMEQATELKKETVKEGSGAEAKAGDTVTVHYVGTFTNGTKFDSSRDRGTPFTFHLGAGEVIKGWDQGVAGMKVGEIRKLTIPSDLGYGPQDHGPIPGGSTLLFEVELLKIN